MSPNSFHVVPDTSPSLSSETQVHLVHTSGLLQCRAFPIPAQQICFFVLAETDSLPGGIYLYS